MRAIRKRSPSSLTTWRFSVTALLVGYSLFLLLKQAHLLHKGSISSRFTTIASDVSDMIHKQQVGHSLPDIVAGLC